MSDSALGWLVVLTVWLIPGYSLAYDIGRHFKRAGGSRCSMPRWMFVLTWLLWPWVVATMLAGRGRRQFPEWAPWWMK